MRTSAVAAVLAVTGSLAVAWAPAATATPSCATDPLGAAGRYAEFVEGDSTRFSDSEGAVAVGGDAYFGDGASNQGFSVGGKLTDADVNALPGGKSLVVGGTLNANQVVIAKGAGVYGRLVDKSTGNFAVDGTHAQGASPVDFAAEFTTLRSLSKSWAALTPNGSAARPEGSTSLLLTGDDAELNVFAVNASDLQRAAEINLKVPAGSSTVVNVLGASYDMNSAPTYGVNLFDPQAGAFVQDDYAAGSAAFKDIRSKLLWNFPQAAEVVKNYTSWPGTVFAPNAKVELGRKQGTGGESGPGHVNGSVVARELVSVPGAETHRMAFTGCLPAGETPGEPIVPAPVPTPTPTEIPEQPKPEPEPESTPEPQSTPDASGAPAPEESKTPDAAAPSEPSDRTRAPEPSQDGPEGDLATTGSSIGPGVIGIAAAAVLAGGGLVAYSVRRRRAQAGS